LKFEINMNFRTTANGVGEAMPSSSHFARPLSGNVPSLYRP